MKRAVVVLALALAGCQADRKLDPPPPVVSADHVAIGDPTESAVWSTDGHHVAFHVAPHEFDRWKRADVWLVVDARTHAMFTIDRISQLAFAPDGAHLGAIENGALVVHDLKTGAASPPSPIAGPFAFAGDAIAWLDPAEVVHRRTLATGREVVFRGLPAGDAPGFEIDDEGRVIASTSAAIRVWQPDQTLLVSIDDRIDSLESSAEGLAYVRRDGDHRLFAFVPLRANARPVTWSRGAELDAYGAFHRCSANLYLVRGPRSFRVLDTTRGTVVTEVGPVRDEYGCEDDVIYAGDLPPGGPYTLWDAHTGQRRRGANFQPSERDDDTPRSQFCPGGQGSCWLAPTHDRIAGPLAGRATLWSAAGKLEWQAPAPSNVAAVGFGPKTLVVVGLHGEVWQLDRGSRALTHETIADCALDDQEAVAVTAGEQLAVPCQHQRTRALVVDAGAPLVKLDDYGWYTTAATSATDATLGWLSYDGAHAYAVPSGTQRWTYPVDHYGFAVTADGSKFAATKTLGTGVPTAYDVSVRDARNTAIATVRFEVQPKALALSPTGAWLAVISDQDIAIVDVAHAKVVDHLPVHHNPPAIHDVVAWAPDGAPRVAYWRPSPAALVIRDVAAQRDVETRLPSRAIDGTVRGIAWSTAGIALVADERVTLWEGDRASSQLGFAGAAGVEVGADGRARALGDPNTARSLFATQ